MKREFSERLERILDKDSKPRFVKLLQNHPAEITKSLVEKCAEFGARKCLLALLNGELCKSDALPALDAHSPNSVTALAYVAHCCPNAQIIDLMLMRCNTIPLVNVSCTIASVHGLPIHFVLLRLSYLELMYSWTQGDSLIKLVCFLCLWKTKLLLDAARSLVQYTDSINDIAWTFVQYGALKQFGALLLIAREKVMAPLDSDIVYIAYMLKFYKLIILAVVNFCCFVGLTIRQYLTNEIDSLSKTDVGSKQAEYKNTLIDAQQLLVVFERVGDALSSYCSSMHKYVAVEDTIVDVWKLLKKAKVHVGMEKLHLNNNFRNPRVFSRIASKTSKILEPGTQQSMNKNWLHVLPAEPQSYYLFSRGKYRPSVLLNRASSTLQPRFMSTTSCCFRKISKPVEPAQQLAYMTLMKLKKGLRFL